MIDIIALFLALVGPEGVRIVFEHKALRCKPGLGPVHRNQGVTLRFVNFSALAALSACASPPPAAIVPNVPGWTLTPCYDSDTRAALDCANGKLRTIRDAFIAAQELEAGYLR